jgi:hypothetical protein
LIFSTLDVRCINGDFLAVNHDDERFKNVSCILVDPSCCESHATEFTIKECVYDLINVFVDLQQDQESLIDSTISPKQILKRSEMKIGLNPYLAFRRLLFLMRFVSRLFTK